MHKHVQVLNAITFNFKTTTKFCFCSLLNNNVLHKRYKPLKQMHDGISWHWYIMNLQIHVI